MDDLAFLGANILRLVAETFGEVRHFYEAFDAAEEARSLVKLLCSDSDSISDAFLESAVENLLHWACPVGLCDACCAGWVGGVSCTEVHFLGRRLLAFPGVGFYKSAV